MIDLAQLRREMAAMGPDAAQAAQDMVKRVQEQLRQAEAEARAQALQRAAERRAAQGACQGACVVSKNEGGT